MADDLGCMYDFDQQLLRKKAPPVMLAASDEHEASLWLQAFLMIINNGVSASLSEN